MNETLKSILRSLHGRSKKYGNFGFSRYEYEKFGLTERTLRTLISQIRDLGYIEFIEQERYIEAGKPRKRNIYRATGKLIEVVMSFTQAVENISEKIIIWCKEQNPIQTMRDFGIEVFSGGRIGSKTSKTTINKRSGSITNWKNGKKWNIFNYLREKEGQGVIEFYKNFIG